MVATGRIINIKQFDYVRHRVYPGGEKAFALPLMVEVVQKPANHRGKPGGVLEH